MKRRCFAEPSHGGHRRRRVHGRMGGARLVPSHRRIRQELQRRSSQFRPPLDVPSYERRATRRWDRRIYGISVRQTSRFRRSRLPGWARNRQAAALGELAAPIGLIMAQRNPLLPRAFEAARGTRPFAGVQTIPNVGHFLMLEAPTRSTIGCATCSGSLQPKLAEA